MGFKRKFDPNPPPKEFVGINLRENTEKIYIQWYNGTILKTFRADKYC